MKTLSVSILLFLVASCELDGGGASEGTDNLLNELAGNTFYTADCAESADDEQPQRTWAFDFHTTLTVVASGEQTMSTSYRVDGDSLYIDDGSNTSEYRKRAIEADYVELDLIEEGASPTILYRTKSVADAVKEACPSV